MVFGFVKQSGGHVSIDSTPGQAPPCASRFRAATARPREARMPQHDAVRGHETILVVEDDADVRLTVVDMLAQLGYKVITASSGEAALRVLDSETPIDLLFYRRDHARPREGRRTRRRAALRKPPLPVLFTSGYTRDEIFHAGRLDPGVMLLGKPYRRDELAARIRSALDAGAGTT